MAAWDFVEVTLLARSQAIARDWPMNSGEVHAQLLDLVCSSNDVFDLQIFGEIIPIQISLNCFTSNLEARGQITHETQILVLPFCAQQQQPSQVCANEFPWSRNVLRNSSSNTRWLVDGGLNDKAKTLLSDSLQKYHQYWFTPEDAWLNCVEGDVSRWLSDMFYFAHQRSFYQNTAIVFDSLDVLFPSSMDLYNDNDHQLLLTFIYELDYLLLSNSKVLIVGLCNDVETQLHPYLLESFSTTIKFRSPNTIEEWEDFFLDRIVGGEGDDDTKLAIAACQHNLSLRQVLSCFDTSKFSSTRFQALVQDQIHFPPSTKVPFTFIPCSNNNGNQVDPFVTVGGQQQAKQTLIEALEWPLTRKQDMLKLNITKPIRGVLLCGPPGAGKTLLAHAASQKFAYNFLSVSVSDLIRGNVGQSEQRVSQLFELARTCKPCIIFFDECHALFASRQSLGPSGQKVLSQFLVEMDQLAEGIVLLAATNEENMVDSALIGRFDRVVTLHGLETREDYLSVLKTALTGNKERFSRLNLDLVVQVLLDQQEGENRFTTGASIVQLLFRAGLEADERNDVWVNEEDIACAILNQ